MYLKNEEDCIKLVPRQYAREILRTSPLTFMEQSIIEEIKEGIEKYIQEYGLQIMALDEGYIALVPNEKYFRPEKVIQERNVLLFDWMDDQSKETFIKNFISEMNRSKQ